MYKDFFFIIIIIIIIIILFKVTRLKKLHISQVTINNKVL